MEWWTKDTFHIRLCLALEALFLILQDVIQFIDIGRIGDWITIVIVGYLGDPKPSLIVNVCRIQDSITYFKFCEQG